MAFAALEDPDDEDRVLFLHAKNNLAPRPQGLAYRLKQTIVGEEGKAITACKIAWEDKPVSVTADAIMSADTSDKGYPREEVAFGFGPAPAVAVLSFLVAFGFEPAHESRGGKRLTE